MDHPEHPPLGGVGAEKPADPEIQALCDSVKHDFEKESGINAKTFKAVCYKTQLVAGTNYYVKMDLGGGQICHLKIYEPLPHTGQKASLSRFQCGKKMKDAINYF